MEARLPFPETLEAWLPPAGILLVGVAVGFLVKGTVVRRLRAFFARTETPLDDLLLEAVRKHVPVWFLLGAIAVATNAAPLRETHQEILHRLVTAALFLSLTFAGAGFVSSAVRAQALGSAMMTGVVGNLLRVVIFATGALLVLSSFLPWERVAPLLAALGIGSLAVALALQDTLSNLFAGIHIVASRMIEVGDYVRLDSGQEGVVVDVGWRFTRLREAADNDILVPNGKVAQAIVVNYQKPKPDLAVPVQIGVAYGADLEQVERVALEVAREVQQSVSGAVPGFPPVVRFHTFADSAIGFAVVLRVRSFPDRAAVVHEFVKRIHARFAKEGLEIPFPQRVVHVRGAKA